MPKIPHKSVGKEDRLFTLEGSVKKNVSNHLKPEVSYDPNIPILGIYEKSLYPNTGILMHTCFLCLSSQKKKKEESNLPKFPSDYKRILHMLYMYKIIKLFSATKMKLCNLEEN